MTDERAETLTDAGCAGGERSRCELGEEAAVRASLKLAVGLARAGDFQRARDLCAAVVFRTQPLIAVRTDLLRITLHALLVARGFTLLSRVVMAIGGRDVQMVLLANHGAGAAPVCRGLQRGRTTYLVDPRWLARLSAEDAFLRRWSDALVCGDRGDADAIGVERPESLLQPA